MQVNQALIRREKKQTYSIREVAGTLGVVKNRTKEKERMHRRAQQYQKALNVTELDVT